MHDWVFIGTVVAVVGAMFYLTLVRPGGKSKKPREDENTGGGEK